MQDLPDIRVDNVFFAYSELTAPWVVRIQPSKKAKYYVLKQGGAWIEVDGCEPLYIQQGGMISCPNGDGHIWYDSPATKNSPGRLEFHYIDPAQELNHTAEGVSRMLISHVPLYVNPVPDLLLPYIYIPPDNTDTRIRLNSVIDTAMLAYHADVTIREAILHRLAEILAFELTDYALKHENLTWHPKVDDRRIRRAIYAIQMNPGHPWTIEALCDVALLSRSAFSEKFHRLVGNTPHKYLMKVRMRRAETLLRTSSDPVHHIALVVGYRSEASFNKAFQREIGLSPGRYRALVSKLTLNRRKQR